MNEFCSKYSFITQTTFVYEYVTFFVTHHSNHPVEAVFEPRRHTNVPPLETLLQCTAVRGLPERCSFAQTLYTHQRGKAPEWDRR